MSVPTPEQVEAMMIEKMGNSKIAFDTFNEKN